MNQAPHASSGEARSNEHVKAAHEKSASPASPASPLIGVVLALLILALSGFFVLRQSPHPDRLRAVGEWDFGNPGWWAYPLERNAFKRDLIRGNLDDVYRLPGSRKLWAVGESGLILYSEDGGEHWVQQHPAPASKPVVSWGLISTAQAMEPPKDWRASKQPDPKAIDQRVQQSVVQQVVDPKAQVGVPVSKLPPGKLIPPNNQSSSVQGAGSALPAAPSDPARADLSGVWFSDESHGWAVGSGGAMLATADGGEHWQVVNSGTKQDLAGVVFASDLQRGWVSTENSGLRVTRDGGRSWDLVDASKDGKAVWSVIGEMAAAAGRSGFTMRANHAGFVRDGGKEIWALSRSGLALMRTPALGETSVVEWKDLFSPLALQMSADGQRILVTAMNGKIRYSTDAGKNWKDAQSGSNADLKSVQCDDALDDCIAVGDSGSVLIGKHLTDWQHLTPGAAANLIWARFSPDGETGDVVTGGGIQLTTDDGGESWYSVGPTRLPASEAKNNFEFVDGDFRWRVGPFGKLERSDDGGNNWRRIAVDTKAWLLSIFFLPDHRKGWMSGSDGTIFATQDGGEHWAPQSAPHQEWLWHISMNADGLGGRALGSYGMVLLTADGGKTWQESAFYSRHPAPWFWFVLLASGFALIMLLPRYLRKRRRTDEPEEGPAASLNSDQPVTHIEQDRLGYRPAVEALAHFLRNAETEPRITIAITGEWGSGKSSMMRMLKTAMEEKGYHAAWFNAWHHQQEGRQLTALFNAVRNQGVPKLFRQPIAWLRVRSRLIWGRSAFYRFVCIAIPVTILIAIGDFSRQPDRWERLGLWVSHHVLGHERVVVSNRTIEKLSARPSAAAACLSAACQAAQPEGGDKPEAVPPAVISYMQNALVWEKSGVGHCADTRPLPDKERCIFTQPGLLLDTIEQNTGRKLSPGERTQIARAIESVPLQPLFPALAHFLLPLAGILGLLFTKGITVYGMELLRPLRGLVGSAMTTENTKEPTGSIEHYRREFCLLTEALDGHLLVFVDDLDRCNAETVNGIMELTNYLVDVGRCFVVLGMAMDCVKVCIRPPEKGADYDEEYADKYLRKLVHIELPVPLANARESLALFAQQPEKPDQRTRRQLALWWHFLRPWLVFALVVVAAIAALDAGRALNNFKQPPIPVIRPQVNAASSSQASSYAVGATAGDVAARTESIASNAPSASGDVGVAPVEPTRMPTTWLVGVAVLLLGALLLRSSKALQERVTLAFGGAVRTRDSEDFRRALEIWIDAVRTHDETPRGVKRFCNRARLFSVYEKQDVDALRHAGQDIQAVPDVHIVALAAIHHVSPEALKGLLLDSAAADPATKATLWNLKQIIDAHTRQFGWPDQEAIKRFIERVERVAVR